MTNKTQFINLRVTRNQKQELKRKAEKCGMTITSYLLFLGLRTELKETKKLL